MCDSKMLLRRFRSKREDVTGFLRKSPDEELHNLVAMVILRKIRQWQMQYAIETQCVMSRD